MDDDGNKSLNFAEFKKGLHDYGVDIDTEKAQELFTILDVNRSGSLDFEEFLVAIRVN